jgi:hypothetical protein
MTVAIGAFGYCDSTGIGRAGCRVAESTLAEGLSWRSVSERPYDRFGRLDALSKYAMAAVEMLSIAPGEKGPERVRWGVVLGTEYGSTEVDEEFLASIEAVGGASPSLFSYTLPSALLGEAAIRHALKGANLTVSLNGGSAEAALWEAASLVDDGSLDVAVMISADAARSLTGEPPAAYALLLEGTQRSSALGAASFERGAGLDDFSVLCRGLKSGAVDRAVSIASPAGRTCETTLVFRPTEGGHGTTH